MNGEKCSGEVVRGKGLLWLGRGEGGQKACKQGAWCSIRPDSNGGRASKNKYKTIVSVQAPKKGINIKSFARNPPPRTPPPRGPSKFFMFGASFPFKTQEKPKHKAFRRGGVLGAPKFFMLKFFVCFICALSIGLHHERKSRQATARHPPNIGSSSSSSRQHIQNQSRARV